MGNMVTQVLIPIIAAFIGAMSAFWYQKRLEKRRDKKSVIYTLMMYRNAGANEIEWINALNVIDVVFNKDKKVRELYRTFISQCEPDLFKNGQWRETFYELVEEMGKCSGYRKLSKSEIRSFYAPESLNIHYRHMIDGRVQIPPTPESLGVYKDDDSSSASPDSQPQHLDKNQSDEKN
ncbi:hypothetical protein SAMN05444285_1614 [Draconibacterium orientale]|uniref:DUF6680 domain-containing protein n=1 Tax=Draconibacterium orientale TaxID=1168034 RepID=X5E254_9BACT|nr:DUF6680 family protein [Draconibacterium orientale]AHW61545.1 hypothetical protein FH5T_03625 [Draconibacterium orientale]SEU15592.1 hypothetical protein SAMN05444285_1614 [Draconibacterium orientale]